MALHSRHIIYLLAATSFAVLQTSCCKHNDIEVEVESEIVMSASLSSTRGIIASADAMKAESVAEGTGFGVFGYKNYNETDQQIFSDTKVAVESGDWTYSPKKYWDRNAYYHFVAYWPDPLGHGMSVSNNTSTHTMTISNVPNWQEGSGASDILLAYSQQSAVNYLNENEGKVRFVFSHMLAQIIVQAWYFGNEDNKPYITGLSVGSAEKPVAAENGTTAIQKIYSTLSDATYTGPTVSGDATLMNNASGDAVEQYFEDEETGKDSPLRTIMTTWLVVPYDAGSETVPISIDYKFGLEGSDQQSNGNVALANLQAGKTYIVTLKFDSSGENLNLDQIIVKDWISGGTMTPSVYNW